jgi:hypothetical protein
MGIFIPTNVCKTDSTDDLRNNNIVNYFVKRIGREKEKNIS